MGKSHRRSIQTADDLERKRAARAALREQNELDAERDREIEAERKANPLIDEDGEHANYSDDDELSDNEQPDGAGDGDDDSGAAGDSKGDEGDDVSDAEDDPDDDGAGVAGTKQVFKTDDELAAMEPAELRAYHTELLGRAPHKDAKPPKVLSNIKMHIASKKAEQA